MYHGAMYAGCIGISGCAVSAHGVSFSVNARGDTTKDPLAQTLAAAKLGAVPVTLPSRVAFDNAHSYTDTVSGLSNSIIFTNVYVRMCVTVCDCV